MLTDDGALAWDFSNEVQVRRRRPGGNYSARSPQISSHGSNLAIMSAAVQRRSSDEMDIRPSLAGGHKSGDRPGFNLRREGGGGGGSVT